jgi:type IV secretory pathway VirB6-like protein
MYWVLTVVMLIACTAFGLCIAAAITLTAWGGNATKVWLIAAPFFVIWVIFANLRNRFEK